MVEDAADGASDDATDNAPACDDAVTEGDAASALRRAHLDLCFSEWLEAIHLEVIPSERGCERTKPEHAHQDNSPTKDLRKMTSKLVKSKLTGKGGPS